MSFVPSHNDGRGERSAGLCDDDSTEKRIRRTGGITEERRVDDVSALADVNGQQGGRFRQT